MAEIPKKGGKSAPQAPATRRGPAKAVSPKPAVRAAEPKGVTLTAAEALMAAELATGDTIAPKAAAPAAPAAKAPAPKASAPAVSAAPAPAPVVSGTSNKPEETVTFAEPPPEVTGTDEAADIKMPELAAEPLPAAEKGTAVMNDVIEASKKYSEDAKARFQTAFADINARAKAGVEKSTKAMEEISDLAKGNVEALVESSRIAVKGVETLGQDAAEYGRLTFEKATATMKSLAAIKTPAEFFQIQSELLSSAFDGFAKEAAKNSETMLKLAGDVVQPLSSRVSVVTEKVKSLAA